MQRWKAGEQNEYVIVAVAGRLHLPFWSLEYPRYYYLSCTTGALPHLLGECSGVSQASHQFTTHFPHPQSPSTATSLSKPIAGFVFYSISPFLPIISPPPSRDTKRRATLHVCIAAIEFELNLPTPPPPPSTISFPPNCRVSTPVSQPLNHQLEPHRPRCNRSTPRSTSRQSAPALALARCCGLNSRLPRLILRLCPALPCREEHGRAGDGSEASRCAAPVGCKPRN